jgi:hypothetical protein
MFFGNRIYRKIARPAALPTNRVFSLPFSGELQPFSSGKFPFNFRDAISLKPQPAANNRKLQ